MRKHQRMRRWLRAEQGSQSLEAAGAALAAALIVLALLAGARGVLGPAVAQAFECAAAVLVGGGGDCGGAAGQTAQAPPAISNTPGQAPPQPEDCGAWCQVFGVGKGAGEGLVALVEGAWTIGSDAYKAATGDQATRDKYAELANAFRNNPWETTKALAGAIVEPMVTDWKEGRYGEALGRGIFEGVGVVIGPKGVDKLGKLSKVDDIARGADRLSDAQRTVNRLPCVGAAPAGKGPGLAKPLANCDDAARAARGVGAAGNIQQVYRVIRPDENPLAGLRAKNPNATYLPEGHVLNGSKPNFRSQYISTTTDINVARRWAQESGNQIVEIDLTKVPGRITDLSHDAARESALKGRTARNWAKGSSEVLIEGQIPPEAIRVIQP